MLDAYFVLEAEVDLRNSGPGSLDKNQDAVGGDNPSSHDGNWAMLFEEPKK
jgi:hypothetical protein